MVHLDESFQMPRDYDTGFILTSGYADKNRTSVPGLQKLPIDFLFSDAPFIFRQVLKTIVTVKRIVCLISTKKI